MHFIPQLFHVISSFSDAMLYSNKDAIEVSVFLYLILLICMSNMHVQLHLTRYISNKFHFFGLFFLNLLVLKDNAVIAIWDKQYFILLYCLYQDWSKHCIKCKSFKNR